MKKLTLLGIGILVWLLSVALEYQQPPPTPTPSQSASAVVAATTSSIAASPPVPVYPVVKVIDGDTISIMRAGKKETVRLIGLDTPETVDPRKPVQCFGSEASDKAKEMLDGASVRLEMDPSQGTLDKYGRTLAYVFLPAPSGVEGPDGTFFNMYMIAEGYGHEYTYRLPYKYQKEFKAAEKQAREQKKGLWADGVCD